MACLEKLVGESLFSVKRNMAEQLRFAKFNLSELQDFSNNVLETYEMWRCLTIIHSVFVEKLNTPYQLSAG